MKSLTIIIVFVLTSAFTQSDNPSYRAAMEKSLTALDEAAESAQLTDVANRFERIARAEKNAWLPWYYAAYATLNGAIKAPTADEKDQQLDQAQRYLDEALALAAEESEVVALQGYIHTIRVTVDPATRGQQLAPQATQTLARAVKMNADNPRALFLLGQMQYGTAQFFGAETLDACELIRQAVDKYESASVEDTLLPTWGEEDAKRMHEQCEK